MITYEEAKAIAEQNRPLARAERLVDEAIRAQWDGHRIKVRLPIELDEDLRKALAAKYHAAGWSTAVWPSYRLGDEPGRYELELRKRFVPACVEGEEGCAG